MFTSFAYCSGRGKGGQRTELEGGNEYTTEEAGRLVTYHRLSTNIKVFLPASI